MRLKLLISILICALSSTVTTVTAQTIEQQLQQMLPSDLVKRINATGDPQRGAILFYQSFLSCSKCHDEAQGKRALGPTLTRYDKKPKVVRLNSSYLTLSLMLRRRFAVFSAQRPRQFRGCSLVANCLCLPNKHIEWQLFVPIGMELVHTAQRPIMSWPAVIRLVP